ncbi:MAG: putative AlkP superfamily pyrophosphatase or phosphodiesterase [Candidatus Azotimanducaceae bacterium]
MKKILIIVLLAISNLSHAIEPTVIVLSWDGMRHDFPDVAQFPALQRLEKEGVRAKSLIPVYPSSTFATHVSMATGVHPEVHGIIDNKFYDRDKGHYAYSGDASWVEAEPIWISAERQGITAATFFWVSSETEWQGLGATYRQAPFDGSVPESEKVDKIVSWLDLPKDLRPHLIMSYWRGADDVAHSKGPNHEDVTSRIHEQDAQLARLLKAIDDRNLWDSTTLLLVSDHGMAEVNQTIDIGHFVEENEIDIILAGGGSIRHIFTKDDNDKAALMTLLSKVPNINAYEKESLPAEFYFAFPNRTGDIVVTTEAPYVFAEDTTLLKAQKLIAPIMNWKTGAHGFTPKNPQMHAIFFGLGRGINTDNKLGSVHQLQIAPTIAKLLAIDPPAGADAESINLSNLN